MALTPTPREASSRQPPLPDAGAGEQAGISIRQATVEDAPGIAALFTATRRTSLSFLPTLHTADEDLAFFGQCVLPTCEVWVAEDGGRIVGFLALKEARVEHLYVLPGYQRRGIAGRLMALAKERSPSGLTLWVFQKNEAGRTFYAAHGFVPARFTDGAENEEREPDVLLRWPPAAE